jgi:hypothetical protein
MRLSLVQVHALVTWLPNICRGPKHVWQTQPLPNGVIVIPVMTVTAMYDPSRSCLISALSHLLLEC